MRLLDPTIGKINLPFGRVKSCNALVESKNRNELPDYTAESVRRLSAPEAPRRSSAPRSGKGETLEAEIELRSRRKFTMRQTYEVHDGPDGGRQLIVTSHVEGGRSRRDGDRELRRVYDAGEP